MKTLLYLTWAFSSASLAYSEISTFDKAKVGTCPAAMQSVTTPGGGESKWEIVADPKAHTPPNVLAHLTADRTPGRVAVIVYRLIEQADGDISLRFKPISGQVEPAIGVVWRFRDAQNYYCARVDIERSTLVVARVENGKWIPLIPLRAARGETTVKLATEVPFNVWSRMNVRFEGTRIRVTVNKQPGCEVDDSAFTSGTVGMWAHADTVAYFDNFEINLLSVPPELSSTNNP